MTGSGTSTDPYIVSTYGELVQAANAGMYIEFPKEPGTINIEDEYGKNEPPQLLIKSGANINGNGWGIHGLWGKTHTCILAGTSYQDQVYSYLSNFNFDSFHSQGDWFLDGGVSGYNALRVQNCIFSGECEKNFMRCLSANYTRLGGGFGIRNGYVKSCSMTVNFTSLNSPCFLEVYNESEENILDFSDCNMKLRSIGELKLFDFSMTNNNKINLQKSTFYLTSDNCKIFNVSSNDTIVSSCVFVGSSQSAIDIGNGAPQTVNVFDAEGFPNAVESIKFVGVPHDKIGDAAYLSKSGLSIGV